MENRAESRQPEDPGAESKGESADATPATEGAKPVTATAAGTPVTDARAFVTDTVKAEGRKPHDALISTLAATPSGSDGEPSYDGLAADAEPPELIAGRYRIKKRIGAGGFGVVFRAIDE